jgi:hypothetical protein
MVTAQTHVYGGLTVILVQTANTQSESESRIFVYMAEPYV